MHKPARPLKCMCGSVPRLVDISGALLTTNGSALGNWPVHRTPGILCPVSLPSTGKSAHPFWRTSRTLLRAPSAFLMHHKRCVHACILRTVRSAVCPHPETRAARPAHPAQVARSAKARGNGGRIAVTSGRFRSPSLLRTRTWLRTRARMSLSQRCTL